MEKLSPYETLRRLHDGERITCPECQKGVIKCDGDCQETHYFYCDNPECSFDIHID